MVLDGESLKAAVWVKDDTLREYGLWRGEMGWRPLVLLPRSTCEVYCLEIRCPYFKSECILAMTIDIDIEILRDYSGDVHHQGCYEDRKKVFQTHTYLQEFLFHLKPPEPLKIRFTRDIGAGCETGVWL